MHSQDGTYNAASRKRKPLRSSTTYRNSRASSMKRAEAHSPDGVWRNSSSTFPPTAGMAQKLVSALGGRKGNGKARRQPGASANHAARSSLMLRKHIMTGAAMLIQPS